MTDPNFDRKEMLDEIINSKKLGDKKFHSETSLQHYREDEDQENKDPGVLNTSVNSASPPPSDEHARRERTMSQPGPGTGNLVTASAARAARKRPLRNVAYAEDTMDQMPRLIINNRGDESGSITPIGDRNYSPFPYNGTLRNGDAKSLNSYRMYASANDLRGLNTPRKRSVATMDAQSLRSVETHAPPPTSPEDNAKLTKKYFTLVVSCIYATILVTLGLIIYMGSPVVEPMIAVIFSIILCSVGLIYHIYLIIDIGRYKGIALKNQRIKSLHEEKVTEYFRKQEEDFNLNTPTPSADPRSPGVSSMAGVPPPVLSPLNHDYCFNHGRHSGSFYLKLGAAGFALGHLIHSVLLIAVQVGQLFDDSVDNDECVSILQVILDVLSPCYAFVQLYFVFKYSNVIILRAQGLAYIALMHIIGSSLCFWVSAIVRETVLALTLYANTRYANITEVRAYKSAEARFIDISGLYNAHCAGSTAMTSIQENFSPYLYPFSVEFNILIVAIYYIIWNNVGHCVSDDANGSEDSNSQLDDTRSVCTIPTAHEDNDFTSNIVIHADCHASNRGLFVGLILTVIVAGMLIIGYVFSTVGTELAPVGYLLNDSTELGVHVIMLFAAVIAINQIRKLDINEHPISLLDDVLLFICIPAFTLETVLSLIATISLLNIIKIVNYVVMAIQVLVQTPLIMDGLRRCSNNKKLRRAKPGREVLMFLIIANVAMWLFYTFSYKSPESLDERYTFYGKVLWSILGHVSLPLIMFYRFHSSVCFADIWNSAYKPGSEH